jgi:hypothetical protein
VISIFKGKPIMSVTFRCPDAPWHVIQPVAHDADDRTEVSDLPEVNFSNSNAAAILRILGLPLNESLSGEISNAQLAQLNCELLLLVNGARQARRRGEVVGPVCEGRVLDMGRSEASMVRRAYDLLALFQQAQQHG